MSSGFYPEGRDPWIFRAAFVGREKETIAIVGALERGANVIVSGRFGMGRTALLRHVAEIAAKRWRFSFADFGLEPAQVCAALLEDLEDGRPPLQARRRRPRYRAARAQLLQSTTTAAPQPCVAVLDNVGRLTAARLGLLRRLTTDGRLRLAAVAEPFLPASDLVRLHAWLAPAIRLTLGPLPPADARAYFAQLSTNFDLGRSAAEIDGLARASCGYPLRMAEQARRELARQAPRSSARNPPCLDSTDPNRTTS